MTIHPDTRARRNWKKIADYILNYFIPIYVASMNKRHQIPIIIDAFAGPGKYDEGSEGSPIIMVKAVKRAQERIKKPLNTIFIFMEQNKVYADNLEENLKKLKVEPPPHIVQGDSQENLLELLDLLKRLINENSIPSPSPFLYLDPWGLKGIDTDLVFKFLELRQESVAPEILLRFPPQNVFRFLKNPRLGEEWLKDILGDMDLNIDELSITDIQERYEEILKKYIEALCNQYYKKYNKKLYVIAIPIIDASPLYYLVFLTEHPYGCAQMSEGMTKSLFKYYKEKYVHSLFPKEVIKQALESSQVILRDQEIPNFIITLKSNGIKEMEFIEFISEFNASRLYPAFVRGVQYDRSIPNIRAILTQMKGENINFDSSLAIKPQIKLTIL
ncbi:MAG: three-Cys-motif partner protein TcmP [Candidatus Desulfofervidaceae bacterium]|nr:three-Cys-motif partner protein TcmP [Candidatus Desulfofervidaceae bacterium]